MQFVYFRFSKNLFKANENLENSLGMKSAISGLSFNPKKINRVTWMLINKNYGNNILFKM